MVGSQQTRGEGGEGTMAASGEAFGENHPATLTYPDPTAEASRGYWSSPSEYSDSYKRGGPWPVRVKEPYEGFRRADDPRDT